ncbi:MAG: hypothetical protein KDC44_19145, partial [Phaeodactylibacter sp.]|nr:hypothetical protein [Phaeodactylibacter sp.]
QGPGYTYNWNGPNNFNSNELNPEVCDTGTYVLIVQNTANGCFGINNVNVSGDLAVPIATAGPDAVLNCSTPNLQLIGQNTGAGTTITYTWEDLSGTTLSSDSLLFIDEADTYVLSVTNEENGCVDLDTVTITENFLLPNADAGPDQDIDCTNSLVTLDGSNSDSGPTIQYEWQTANGLVLGTNPTQDVQTAGQFYLILTDSSNGCQDTSVVTVQQDQNAPVAIVGPDQAITCVVDQVTLDGTSSSVGPSIIYSWLDESNMEISQSPLVTVQTPGTYTLIVENTSNNCVDSVDTEVLLDNLPPATDAGTDATVTCDQPNVELGSTIIPSGANWQITWTNQNGQTVGSDSTLTVSDAGTFTLSILNLDNGCEAADVVVVDANNTPPTAVPGPDGLLTCAILALDLDGSQSSSNGPLVFEWQDGAGSTLGNSPTLNINSPDQYTLIVEDQVSGCLDSAQV